MEQQSAAALEGKDASEAMEALKKKINDIYCPPAAEPSPGESGCILMVLFVALEGAILQLSQFELYASICMISCMH